MSYFCDADNMDVSKTVSAKISLGNSFDRLIAKSIFGFMLFVSKH